jgi:hypothetical protein
MMTKDPFGFDAVAQQEPLDLTAFAPKPRPVDRVSANAASEVAQDAGFTRRTAVRTEIPARAKTATAPVAAKAPKRRVNIHDLLGIEDRYPQSERAQLNMLAPVPVVLRWRQLVKDASVPAWEVLERAMEALEAGSGADTARRRS